MQYPIPASVIPCTNPALEIRYTHEKGRGVFATRRIAAWQRLECSPVLYIPPRPIPTPSPTSMLTVARPGPSDAAPLACPHEHENVNGEGVVEESWRGDAVRDVLGQYTYTLRTSAHSPPSSTFSSSSLPSALSPSCHTTCQSSTSSLPSSTCESPAKSVRGPQRQEVLALGLGSLFNHVDPPNVTYKIHAAEGWIEYTSTRTIEEGEELGIWYGSNLTWMHGPAMERTAATNFETENTRANRVYRTNDSVAPPSSSSSSLASTTAKSSSSSTFLTNGDATAFSRADDAIGKQTVLRSRSGHCESYQNMYPNSDSDDDEQEFLKRLAEAVDIVND